MSCSQSWLLQYVGCLGINTSMKSLDFETRSIVAKECINRVCEAAGLKTVDKKRRTDKRVAKMLADGPNMDKAGSNVTLTVTSSYLSLIILETGEIIAKHDMPNISFASGGDAETLDFVAYVAKDSKHGRACFVLECGGGLAQEVINAIGQAFEHRFKEFLKKTPKDLLPKFETNGSLTNTAREVTSLNHTTVGAIGGTERDYYNDLPGKMPPDINLLDSVDSNLTLRKETMSRNQPQAAPRTCFRKYMNSNSDQSHNLIDLTSDIQLPETQNINGASSDSHFLNIPSVSTEHQYVNFKGYESDNSSCGLDSSSNIRDPFDMQPFNSVLENVGEAANLQTLRCSSPQNRNTKSKMQRELEKEEWFHGPISRKESEILVAKDGDFLIRESQGSSGQYVLTGMQGGMKKHLLLVDPEGVVRFFPIFLHFQSFLFKVRTKDKTFESVSHLINYHLYNGLPIISAESVLILRTPVKRKR
ncbi:SHC-transforming protein 1-like protein [Dinothrombium tinctorium]|uniref:SHC-transforming protein 1-like protein n=1 Tax=Dinothrombium tinctorium TaxID=1965070 RepID=A0A3S3P9S4_9ACAR|nr:SHC-transforming protein 1-like protein [Dinothrombium tinctorium]